MSFWTSILNQFKIAVGAKPAVPAPAAAPVVQPAPAPVIAPQPAPVAAAPAPAPVPAAPAPAAAAPLTDAQLLLSGYATYATPGGRHRNQSAADKAADAARQAYRANAVQQHIDHAKAVWANGNAADKAMLFRDPVFTNHLKNDPALASQFGFSSPTDVNSTINGLLAGDLGGKPFDDQSPIFKGWGGTDTMTTTMPTMGF